MDEINAQQIEDKLAQVTTYAFVGAAGTGKSQRAQSVAALVDAVLAEDVEAATQLATDLMNSLIDIPGLDEEAEGLLFKGVLEIIVGAILSWIEQKTEEPVVLQLNR